MGPVQKASFAIVLALAALVPASAQVTGRATALGSDTLAIDSQVFQLFGVDGIEFHQFCLINGRPWACGASATRALQTLLDAVVVDCTPTGERNGAATFATCASADGDIAENMVRQGFALADRAQSDEYVAAEETARVGGDGIWRGTFEEPWAYRADIAAIERRYAELALETVHAEAERALTVGGGGIDIFNGYHILKEPDGGASTDEQIRVAEIEAGFIADAIEPYDVFTWAAVSQALESWRQSASAAVAASVVDTVWTSLLHRPNQVVEVIDSGAYYAAVSENAAPWIERERQPVLLVAAPTVPTWISSWFNGSPPEGAEISRKADINTASYLGTVDGVDVYVGDAPHTESLLFPDDLLVKVTHRGGGNGSILAIGRDVRNDPGELVVRYSMGIEWLDDPVLRLRYPEPVERLDY